MNIRTLTIVLILALMVSGCAFQITSSGLQVAAFKGSAGYDCEYAEEPCEDVVEVQEMSIPFAGTLGSLFNSIVSVFTRTPPAQDINISVNGEAVEVSE